MSHDDCYTLAELAAIIKVPVNRIAALLKSGQMSAPRTNDDGIPVFNVMDIWRIAERLRDEDMEELKARAQRRGKVS